MWVERNQEGQIVGAVRYRQDGFDEFLEEDNEELQSFLNRPV